MPGLRLVLLLRSTAREKGVRIVAHHAARREQVLEEELGCIVTPTSCVLLLKELVLERVVLCVSGSTSTAGPYHAYLGRHLLLLLSLWLLAYAIDGHSAMDLRLSIAPK